MDHIPFTVLPTSLFTFSTVYTRTHGHFGRRWEGFSTILDPMAMLGWLVYLEMNFIINICLILWVFYEHQQVTRFSIAIQSVHLLLL